MKILVITPTFFPIMGGAEVGIREISFRLAQKHEVKILAPFADKDLLMNYGSEEPADIQLNRHILRFKDRINLKKWPGQWKLKGIVPPFSISCAHAALKNARDFKPDIINVFYPLPAGFAALVIEFFSKIPVVISIIGRDIPGPNIPPFWKYYSRLVSKVATERIFISEYCRKALYGSNYNLGSIIPFGVDINKFRPGLDCSNIKENLKIPRDAEVLFSLQRLDQWKRVDVIIEAMKYVLERRDIYLVIGGKGPEAKSLIQRAHELNLSTRIIFKGYIKQDDLPFYYAMSDIFVFHSKYETFGLALLQAMAAGKPVVSVNTTAIPELIHHNQNGILVEPFDPEGLADAIVSLLEDKDSMNRYSRESRKRVLQKYVWDKIADKYEEVFYRCLK